MPRSAYLLRCHQRLHLPEPLHECGPLLLSAVHNQRGHGADNLKPAQQVQVAIWACADSVLEPEGGQPTRPACD